MKIGYSLILASGMSKSRILTFLTVLPVVDFDALVKRCPPEKNSSSSILFGTRIALYFMGGELPKNFLKITYFKLARCSRSCFNAFDEEKRHNIKKGELQGFKYFKAISGRLESLHQTGCQCDRTGN
jgi:hypothetical protein